MFGHKKAISAALATVVSACDPTQGFSDACVCGHDRNVNCEDLARRGNSTDTHFADLECCSDLNKNGCTMDAYGRVHDLADGEDSMDDDLYNLIDDVTSWREAPRTSTWADAKSTLADDPKKTSTWADAPEDEFSTESDDECNMLSNGKSTWADAPLGISTWADQPKKSTWADAPKIDLSSMNSTWETLLGTCHRAHQKVQDLRRGGLAAAEAYAAELEQEKAAAGWPLNKGLPPFAQGKAAAQDLSRGGLAGAQAMLAQLEQQERMKNARRSSVDSRSAEIRQFYQNNISIKSNQIKSKHNV